SRDVPVASGDAVDRAVIGQAHLVAATTGLRNREVSRVVEGCPRGQGVLPGDAAHGEAVPPVGGDVDLDRLGSQPEHGAQVVPRSQSGEDVGGQLLGEHDDPVVVLTQTQLERRTDHARTDVPIGLAGGYLEVARQDAAGEDHRDEIADV